jgi:DNA-binding response OmpR family regulator
MDVLIVERDELVGATLVAMLEEEGISAAVASDEEALNLVPDTAPQVAITRINRGHNEDLAGLNVVSAMRRKWSKLRAVYLAALWPVHLRREVLTAGERFLANPVSLAQLTRTVRELLASGPLPLTIRP